MIVVVVLECCSGSNGFYSDYVCGGGADDVTIAVAVSVCCGGSSGLVVIGFVLLLQLS